MRLTFAVIIDYLKAKYNMDIVLYRGAGNARKVGNAIIGAQYCDLKETIFILEDFDNLYGSLRDKDAPVIVLCREGSISDKEREAAESFSNIAVSCTHAEAAKVLGAVNEIVTRFNDWGERMLDAVRTKAGWFDIIDLGHEVFENPMLIYDRSMKLLAFTRTDGSEDAIWKDTVSEGTALVRDDYQSKELMKYVRKLDGKEKVFKHKGAEMTDPFYTCVIRKNSKRVGMITEMEHNHEITRGELDMLEQFADFVSIRMAQYDEKEARKSIIDSMLVADILRGEIDSAEQLNTRMLAARWKAMPYYRLVQFVPMAAYISDEQITRSFATLPDINLRGSGRNMNDEETAIYYIWGLESEELLEHHRAMLSDFCRNNMLRCGISDAYVNLLDTHKYKEETNKTIAFANDRLATFDSVRGRALWSMIRSIDNIDLYMHRAITQLSARDEAEGTEYVRTLEAFLRNKFRQVDAATELGVHRTTLLYRLNKIREITGLDFENEEEMLNAAISIMVKMSNI